MHAEIFDSFVGCELKNDRLNLYCHISNGYDVNLNKAIQAWAKDDDDVEISLNFHLGSILDFAVENHEMPSYDNAIDEQYKPLFDAMRAELAAMIERIDGLAFINPHQEQPQ